MQAQQHDMSVKDLKSAEGRLGEQGHVMGINSRSISVPVCR
jgi:hypothetical protein